MLQTYPALGDINSSEIQNVKTVDSGLRNANRSTGQGSRFVCSVSQRACTPFIPAESRSTRVGLLCETTLGFFLKKKKRKQDLSKREARFCQYFKCKPASAGHHLIPPRLYVMAAPLAKWFSDWAHLLQCFENKYKMLFSFIFFFPLLIPGSEGLAAEQKELEEPAACLRTLQQSGSSLTRDLEAASFSWRVSAPLLCCSYCVRQSRRRTCVNTSLCDEGRLWNYCGIKLLWRSNAVWLTESRSYQYFI